MPLYEFNEAEVKFLQELVPNVNFSGKLEQLDNINSVGKSILKSLNSPINPIGKPKNKEMIE